jgi:outer membrane autotransporter protein
VTWSVSPAVGSLSPATTTGSDGRSSNTMTLDADATGTVTVAATTGGFSVVFTVNVGGAAATVNKVSGDVQLVAPGATTAPLVVALADSSGQPAVGVTVSWSVEPQDAGSLISASTTTGSNGRTSNTLTLAPTASGAITVTAAAGGVQVAFTVITNFANMPGLTPNQRSTAQALQNTCGALQGGTAGLEALAAACTAQGSELITAVQQITPDQISSQGNNSVEIQHTQFVNITSRMVQLRAGATGANFNELALDVRGQPLLTRGLDYLLDDASGGGASADEPDPLGRLGVFVNGSGSFGDRDTTTDELGFDFDTAGITAGADYRLTDKLILGGALGYVYTNMDYDSSRGDQDVKGYTLSAYGTWYQSQNTYIDGIVSYGWNNFDIDRRIRFGTTDVTAKGSTDGTELAASIGGGYDFNRAAFTFGPFARVNYIRAEIDSYNEDPTGGLEQGFDDQNAKSLTSLLGGQMSYAISSRYGVFSPQLRTEWAHEFKDDSRNITARFLNDPTSGRFEIGTDDPDRDYFNLGAGVSGVFARGRSAFIYYETTLGRDNLTEHSIAAGLRLEF